MSYYIVYQLETPCFQLIRLPSVMWSVKSSITEAIKDYNNPGDYTIKPFETINERINFLSSSTRHFSYYGPFNSVDELSSYIDNHPELLI